MSEKGIVRLSSEELKGGDTDWDRVEALTDHQIEAAIQSDPDAAPELDEEWFRSAVLAVPAKMAMSLRVDTDVLEWFRSQGKGWQTRMNSILRAYAKAHGGVP
jgi:uncharacterized protein (DUF4415 family)